MPDTFEISKDEMLDLFGMMVSNLVDEPHDLLVTGLGKISIKPEHSKRGRGRRTRSPSDERSGENKEELSATDKKRLISALKKTVKQPKVGGMVIGSPVRTRKVGKGITKKDFDYFTSFTEGPSVGSSEPATNKKKAGTPGNGKKYHDTLGGLLKKKKNHFTMS